MPPEIGNVNKDVTIKQGHTLEIDVPFEAFPEPTAEVLFDNKPTDNSVTSGVDENMCKVKVPKVSKPEHAGVFTVKLQNAYGVDSVAVTTTVLGPPTTPQDTDVVSYGRDFVEIKWQPPADDGGSPVTSYLVERRDANRNAWIRVNEVPADTLTAVAKKLVEGNQYYLRVSAINEIDQGPAAELSEPVTAKCAFGELHRALFSAH